jgi:hypothetical protein
MSLPLRQFRVSIVETPESARLGVVLQWRTFPCVASHWDGTVTCWVPGTERPIESQEALRRVLAALAAQPWKVGHGYPS